MAYEYLLDTARQDVKEEKKSISEKIRDVFIKLFKL